MGTPEDAGWSWTCYPLSTSPSLWCAAHLADPPHYCMVWDGQQVSGCACVWGSGIQSAQPGCWNPLDRTLLDWLWICSPQRYIFTLAPGAALCQFRVWVGTRTVWY